MVTYGHIWCLITYELPWSNMIMCEETWSYMIPYDLCTYVHTMIRWSYAFKYDHRWSHMINYDRIYVSICGQIGWDSKSEGGRARERERRGRAEMGAITKYKYVCTYICRRRRPLAFRLMRMRWAQKLNKNVMHVAASHIWLSRCVQTTIARPVSFRFTSFSLFADIAPLGRVTKIGSMWPCRQDTVVFVRGNLLLSLKPDQPQVHFV